MLKVEMQVREESPPWRRVKLAAAPRVGDLIAMDIRENVGRVERLVRVDRVIFVADPSDQESQDEIVLQVTPLSEDDAASLALA